MRVPSLLGCPEGLGRQAGAAERDPWDPRAMTAEWDPGDPRAGAAERDPRDPRAGDPMCWHRGVEHSGRYLQGWEAPRPVRAPRLLQT